MQNFSILTEGYPNEKELYDAWDLRSDNSDISFGNNALITFREFGIKLDVIIQSGTTNPYTEPYLRSLVNTCEYDKQKKKLINCLLYNFKISVQEYGDTKDRGVSLNKLEQRYVTLILQKNLPEMTIQGAPIDKIDSWTARVDMDVFAPIVVFSIILVSSSLIVYPLVEEKQDGIREILSIATSYSYLNQLAMYMTNTFILFLIIVVDMIILIAFDSLNQISIIHPILLSVILVFSIVSFSFFVSVFFETGEFLC